VEDRIVSAPADGGQTVGGCVVWIAWTLGGNLVLLTLLIFVMREQQWELTGKDVAFWAVVATVVGLRYIDLTRFGGRQIDGSPAYPGLFKTYALRFVGGWLVLWALAHSVEWLP
jgi:hypothetical protein